METTDEQKELIKEKKMTQPLDKRFHYNEFDRDFLVNMAGCEWGRDCWAEMYAYRELSIKLNRTLWQKFRDMVVGLERIWGRPTKTKVPVKQEAKSEKES